MDTRRNIHRVIGGLFLLANFCTGFALGDTRVAATPLIAHEDPVALPGVGRMLFAFAITVAVGIGIVYALRKLLPRFVGQTTQAGELQVLAQTRVHQGLRLQVVAFRGHTVLVAEGKSGIAMTVMPAAETKLKQIES